MNWLNFVTLILFSKHGKSSKKKKKKSATVEDILVGDITLVFSKKKNKIHIFLIFYLFTFFSQKQ